MNEPPPSEPVPPPRSRYEDVPQFYSDGFQIRGSAFTAFLEFYTNAPDEAASTVAVVRMSPTWVKVMAIILKKQVQLIEDQLGAEITIPPNTLAAYEIDLERDWQR